MNATITGISSAFESGPDPVRISKNKIYDLAGGGTSSIVNGISTSLAPAAPVFITNNIIGLLKSPASTGTNAIRGMDLGGTAPLSVYNNTIFLNAVSNSSSFGSS